MIAESDFEQATKHPHIQDVGVHREEHSISEGDYNTMGNSMQDEHKSLIRSLLDESPLSDDLILYHILVGNEYGWAVFESSKNNPISFEEIDSLIAHLTAYRKERIERQLADKSKIFFPCELPYINTDPKRVSKRPPTAKRYKGVYFATHPREVGLIKIGCSIDVYSRMQSLLFEYGREALTVVGFIETDDYRQIEGYIHKILKQYRQRNEWFREAGVLEWLKDLTS